MLAGRNTGVAGVRAPGGRAPTPGKHLLDNVSDLRCRIGQAEDSEAAVLATWLQVLLSQDVDDGLQVVWASSPTAALSPQKAGSSHDAAPCTSLCIRVQSVLHTCLLCLQATGESQDTARTASQQHTQGGNNSQASRDGFRRALALAAHKAASDVPKLDIEDLAGYAGGSQAQSQVQAKEQPHDENAAPELQQLQERKSSHR